MRAHNWRSRATDAGRPAHRARVVSAFRPLALRTLACLDLLERRGAYVRDRALRREAARFRAELMHARGLL